MNLLKKLQTKLLQKDVKNGKNPESLAEKYPMSMLVQNKIFERIENTELYRHNSLVNELYNIEGKLLGNPCLFSDDCQYVIVSKNDGEFKNGTGTLSYAVYDKQGNCVVPHNCYSRCYFTEGYAMLSTAMKPSHYMDREERIEQAGDNCLKMSATGMSLVETLGGSTINPKTLVIASDRIITTNYISVEPLKPYGELEVYPRNTVWISQNEKNEEITFKFNKNLKLLETYRLPMYSHNIELFFIDSNTGAVYLLDTENKRRINLRTGDYINLLNLRRAHLSKKEIFADPEDQENIDNIVDGAIQDIVSIPLEEVVDGLVDEENATEEQDDVVIAVEKEDEVFDLSIVADDEIGEYDPSLDNVGKKDQSIELANNESSVDLEVEIVPHDDTVSVTND